MLMNIDPCSLGPVLMSCLVVYTKLVIEGKNIRNKECIRSETVKDYIVDVNKLFTLRQLPVPVPNFSDRTNAVATLIDNLKKEEVVANQRSPLTPAIVAKIITSGKDADPTSLEALMYDIIVISREIGPRAAEISQRKANAPDYHTYPSGKTVIKAICADWWTLYDGSENIIQEPSSPDISKATIRWKIQKNRRNGEQLTYINNAGCTLFSVPRAVISMIKRARLLEQPDSLPLAVYKSKVGQTKYLTARVLTSYLRKIAKKVHPTWTDEQINKISAHSLRVWACILLHEAGKGGDYIRKRLRWLSEAYRVYLRDSSTLASKHNHGNTEYAALVQQIMLTHLPEQQENQVPEDNEMGQYTDIE